MSRAIRSVANLNALGAVLIMVPPLSLAYYVAVFGVNVILWDEWATVSVLEKWMQGTLSISDLFAQHNEHRIFFHRIDMLIMERLTGFNSA